MLVNELSHRVKNTLAVVQSLARQTLRATSSSDEFVERFEGRLSALASAHQLLFKSEWRGRIGDTCHEPVERLRRRQEKLQMEGEPLELPPSLATPFGLVLHELATNAAKYGALHTEDGRVKLSWKRGNNHRELIVVWEESGGPPVEPPAKQGFGGAMIEKLAGCDGNT